jgi:hypothetical protein
MKKSCGLKKDGMKKGKSDGLEEDTQSISIIVRGGYGLKKGKKGDKPCGDGLKKKRGK